MAKRRAKRRTHAGASAPATKSATPSSIGHANIKDPKSMVVRVGAGEVGPSVSQLCLDVRRVMEPGTASRLKERRANKTKDYVAMCGPLGVTHLMLFSRSETGNTNLRLAVTPRGPTLHFRIDKYSLAKDVRKAQRHPKGGGKEYITPPLLVMNNFTSPTSDAKSQVPRHLETLTTSVCQSLFPSINPQTTPIQTIRRVLLLNRENSKDKDDDGSFILNFRHYAITTRAAGISKPLRRLDAAEKLLGSKSRKAQLPNLGGMQDIADYMVRGEGDGYMTDATSGSELDTDAEVEVLQAASRKVLTAKARSAAAAKASAEAEKENDSVDGSKSTKQQDGEPEDLQRRAIKLVELGPRMKLRLTKVEEGFCGGKIMWHEYIHKSKEELREMEKVWEKRRQEKAIRKKEQKENVEKKKAAKAAERAKNAKSGKAAKRDGEEDGESSESDDFDYADQDVYDSDNPEGDVEMLDPAQREKTGEWEDEDDEVGDGA